jgi:cell division protein FtsQ
LLIIAILWASGVFGQLSDSVAQSSDGLFITVGFSVQQVNVTGRKYTSKEGLYEALSISQGDSLLNFELDSARRRIEVLDWVDQARVMRLWPGSLQIDIVERRPSAIWQLNGQLALVDREGQIISSEHLSDFANLPHVVGQGAAKEAAELIDLLDRYPVIRSRVRAAIRVSGRRWNLRLDNGVDVKLPDDREEEALRRLLIFDDRHRLLARDIATIDLRMEDRMFISLRSNEILHLNVPGMDT